MKTTSHCSLSLLAAIGLLAACSSGCDKSDAATNPKLDQDVIAKMRESQAAGGAEAGGGGTGWGALKGTFTYNGEAKPLEAMNVTITKDCGVTAVYNEALRVDPSTKGLRDVVIYARKVSRVTPDYAAAPTKDVYFDQIECRFTSHVAVSTLKDKFIIINNDNATHNSKGAPPGGNPEYNSLIPAHTKATSTTGKLIPEFKKATPVPYDVTCSIHPWMKAWHIVRNDPYVAVTDEKGNFTIDKLPAGEPIEFQVWHELGTAEGKGLRADPKWKASGRFTMTIPENGTAELVVKVEPSALGK